MTAASPAVTPAEPALEPELLARLSRDPAARIDEVIAFYRRQRRPVELFESLKMKSRLQYGLPMIAPPDESISMSSEDDSAVQRGLENGLLDACRQAGAMLIESGKIGEGWMYLRPLGDPSLARRLLSKVEINDDNYDEMLHVLLHEGVDLQRGFDAALERQGTCNSITLFDSVIADRSRSDRKIAAACLLGHLYEELDTRVREDFEQRSSENGVAKEKAESDLEKLPFGELVATHKWILGGGGYHLDTTHLSSVVRFAVVLDDPELIAKALELCQYGRRLPADFQYPGQEPFVDFYPAHIAFFSALLGKDVDAALRLFEQKARTVDAGLHGSGAVETYIDLLDRIGRPSEALRAAMELFPAEVPIGRVLPEMIEMAGRAAAAGDAKIAGELEQFCFDHGDLLGVAAVSELLSPKPA
ncbi:hypothetical protein [Allorhodopirellula solitaria]|uniref:Uncharacterized protein n=1 Tax=Allorhodopirellula solitaria TaxID=2527987 RepID=A0A5C5YIR8_9BACT|nr:hypothetical protein [Allorhodopirellula solitaria]TWT74765.1 hypothetical protein CA85_00500 [Allorhodopirellula solitaria]